MYIPYYRNEDYSEEHSRSDMASLPLPNPAVVIDVRSDITQPYPLVWNLATEIEDLTKEMHLQQVARWRYLKDHIDFLRLSPLPGNRSLIETSHFDIMKRNAETQSFSRKEELADYVGREYVDRVRNNRIKATQDEGESEHFQGSEADPLYTTVRIFFVVDMLNETSLRSAASYAKLLKNRDIEHDTIGRAKRLTVTAICMNADPPQRELVYEEQDESIQAPNTIFDLMILLQSYRDDDAYIGIETQATEMELILYLLLLVPPEQIIERRLQTSEQEILRDILQMQGEIVAPLPCPVYLLGVSSIEYSARWGTRYLKYGLAKKVLQILLDAEGVEQGDALLELPDTISHARQDWLQQWWSRLEQIAIRAPVPFVPEKTSLDIFQKVLANNPFASSIPLRDTLASFENYHQAINQQYRQVVRAIRSTSEENELQVTTALQQLSREREVQGEENNFDQTETEILALLDEAEQFTVTMFRRPAGVLPRAQNQLSELAARLKQLEHVTWKPREFIKHGEQFESAANEARQVITRAFRTWNIPFFRRTLRSTVLLLLAFIIGGAILIFTLPLLPVIPGPLTHALFASISLLNIALVVILAIVLWLALRAHWKRLRRQRERTAFDLQELAQIHLKGICSAFTTRLGFILLEQAGIYAANGNMCQQAKYLRSLDLKLDEARETASVQQERVFERLSMTLNSEQVGMQKDTPWWMYLNSRRDLLPWEQLVQVLQETSQKLENQDEFFHALAKMLLRLLNIQPGQTVDIFTALELTSKQDDNVWHLHMLSSALVASMLLASSLDYDLAHTLPLVNRYLELEVNSAKELSGLSEYVVALRNDLKDVLFEQTMREQATNRYRQQLLDHSEDNAGRVVENILGAWVEYQYLQDASTRRILRSTSITSRLREFRMKPSRVLEDIQKRCQLLGYREQTQVENSESFYMLFVPDPVDREFMASLATARAAHIERVHFPDKEKLVYAQIHRMHSGG